MDTVERSRAAWAAADRRGYHYRAGWAHHYIDAPTAEAALTECEYRALLGETLLSVERIDRTAGRDMLMDA